MSRGAPTNPILVLEPSTSHVLSLEIQVGTAVPAVIVNVCDLATDLLSKTAHLLMVAQLVFNLPVQASSDPKTGQLPGIASIQICVVEAMASTQNSARRTTRRAASAGPAIRTRSRSPVRCRAEGRRRSPDTHRGVTVGPRPLPSTPARQSRMEAVG